MSFLIILNDEVSSKSYWVALENRVRIRSPENGGDIRISVSDHAPEPNSDSIAEITRKDATYYLRAVRDAVIIRDGEQTSANKLKHGDRIILGSGAEFEFSLPWAGSSTALLDVLSGQSVGEAQIRRIILMDDTLLLSSGEGAHIIASGLSDPLTIFRRDETLFCRSKRAGLNIDGRDVGQEGELHIPCQVRYNRFNFQIEPFLRQGRSDMGQFDGERKRKIRDYTLVEEIYSTGYTNTYLARSNIGKNFVIKHVIRSSEIEKRDGTKTDRLQIEERGVEAWKSLQHPVLVDVVDYWKEGDDFFVVTDWIDGVPLSEKLGTFTEKEAVEITLKICEGVACYQQKMIVHRDLKPGNIMLAQYGPVIIDPGFATIASHDQPSVILGTPGYYRPSRVEGGGYNIKTDIYSLGIVLYEMVKGKRQGRQAQPDASGLSECVANVVEKAYNLQYENVEDIVSDLQAARDELAGEHHEPLKYRPETTPQRRRSRRVVRAAALLALLIALAVAYMGVRWKTCKDEFQAIKDLVSENQIEEANNRSEALQSSLHASWWNPFLKDLSVEVETYHNEHIAPAMSIFIAEKKRRTKKQKIAQYDSVYDEAKSLARSDEIKKLEEAERKLIDAIEKAKNDPLLTEPGDRVIFSKFDKLLEDAQRKLAQKRHEANVADWKSKLEDLKQALAENRLNKARKLKRELTEILQRDMSLDAKELLRELNSINIPAPTFGTLVVKTDPPGAEIYLDTEEKGASPATIEKVSPGQHKLTVVAPQGYVDQTITIEIESDEKKELTIKLERQLGSLLVASDPVGADVSVDNRRIGKTDENGLRVPNLPVGEHDVHLEKDKYHPTDKKVTIRYLQTTRLDVKLSPKPGRILVSSTPKGAKIYLDGVDTGAKTPATLNEAPSGRHTLRLEKEGYESKEIHVKLAPEGFEQVTLQLPAIPRGDLSVATIPEGSEVILDGHRQRGVTPMVIEGLKVGKHSVVVRKEGYVEQTITAEIKSGERKELLAIKLERKQLAQREITNSIGMKLVLIPAGEFVMGSPKDEEGRYSDEGPQHPVRITEPFYMGKYEVTQQQYEAIMGKNPSWFKGLTNPVEQVSWNDAVEFRRKLSEKEGREYRLPTEAEWEYACRAGTTTPFAFGETISTDQANYDGNYTYGRGKKGVYRGSPLPVGSLKPNAWGLYDMHGNVWEWCADWYDEDYYKNSPVDDPKGPPSGSFRVLRGGSWDGRPRDIRSAVRSRYDPTISDGYVGFRVVLRARGFR